MEFYKDCYDIITDPRFNKITNLELIIGTKCQNACKYCYRVKDQYKGSIIGMPISRAKMYIENAIEMGFIDSHVPFIDFFGGDPVVDLDYFKDLLKLTKNYTNNILVPTNARLLERIKDKDIDEFFEISDGKLSFSLSIDSPCQEENRPLSSFGKMQGMVYERNWDRIIHLSNKYNMGVHPMLYFDTVDKWYDTWEFFVSKQIHCYLLEVRHPMTKEQMFEGVYQLVKIRKTADKMGIKESFNATSPSYTNRGMTCSAETTFSINTDGCSYLCHRLMNDRFKIADLNTKEVDPSKFVMWKGLFHRRNQPICMGCPIRSICATQCLGAVHEYWGGYGAVTIPIPSVCQYFLLKFYMFGKVLGNDWKEFMNQYVNMNVLEKAVFGNFGEQKIREFEERLHNV